MQKAVDEELIPTNPCKKVQLPKDEPKEMQTLKANELAVFLQETKDSGCYEFYLLEITTGLRLGEILALTWDDLDMKNKTISVNKQVQRIKSELKATLLKQRRQLENQYMRRVLKSINYFKEQTTTEYKTDLSVTNYKWLQRFIINNTKIAPNAKESRGTANTFSRFATQLCNLIA